MSDRLEQAGRNALITLLGGLVEPSSEVAQPIPPYGAGADMSPEGVQVPHTAHTTEDVKGAEINPSWMVWGSLGIGLLVVVVLIVMLVKD